MSYHHIIALNHQVPSFGANDSEYHLFLGKSIARLPSLRSSYTAWDPQVFQFRDHPVLARPAFADYDQHTFAFRVSNFEFQLLPLKELRDKDREELKAEARSLAETPAPATTTLFTVQERVAEALASPSTPESTLLTYGQALEFAAREASIHTLDLDCLPISGAIHKRFSIQGTQPALCFWVFNGPHPVLKLTDRHWEILELNGLVREKTRDIKNLPPALRQAFRSCQASLRAGEPATARAHFDQVLAFYTTKRLEIPEDLQAVYTKLLVLENPLPNPQKP